MARRGEARRTGGNEKKPSASSRRNETIVEEKGKVRENKNERGPLASYVRTYADTRYRVRAVKEGNRDPGVKSERWKRRTDRRRKSDEDKEGERDKDAQGPLYKQRKRTRARAKCVIQNGAQPRRGPVVQEQSRRQGRPEFRVRSSGAIRHRPQARLQAAATGAAAHAQSAEFLLQSAVHRR